MSTEVEICNEALTALGENPIVALTDDNKSARLCNLKYANNRDYLLRRYQWKFAIQRDTLSPDTAVPKYEFSAQFTLPDDCIQFIEIYPDTVSYRIEQGKILCDEAELQIRYTQQITDPDMMDSTFIMALAALLSREMAIALTESNTKHSKMDELFEVKLSEARFAGSIEDDIEAIQADDWLLARY